jgi:hypothetical protein
MLYRYLELKMWIGGKHVAKRFSKVDTCYGGWNLVRLTPPEAHPPMLAPKISLRATYYNSNFLSESKIDILSFFLPPFLYFSLFTRLLRQKGDKPTPKELRATSDRSQRAVIMKL